MKNYLILLTLFVILVNCSGENESTEEQAEIVTESKQLNITILLDLSDRIEPTKYPNTPEHFERDIEIVKYFTEIFREDMEERGAFKAKGKLKVIFNPLPEDKEINKIASELFIDLSHSNNTTEKKRLFDTMPSTFEENLRKIYRKTIETKNYPGSDIWRFFKNDVKDFAITSEGNYRNILVILTDGYLYHESSNSKTKNRSMSLLPDDIHTYGFRNPNWKEKFDNGDYGYITETNGLDDLEVLVLEINPSLKHKDDEDVLKLYLTKWFEEMGINHFKLYNSVLPTYTQTRIDDFIQID